MAKILRHLRQAQGLTQAQLANALHVHQTAVSQWECGRTFPDRETIVKLAAFYSVSADIILGI
ncbi:MAG: helix-turn-helix domain-containing protein [Oscillospiraceae bacterium]|jgi:repressor LexA|nr:helix-turn-helix domain-containing protein [Oscillospiraceae bacterium]